MVRVFESAGRALVRLLNAAGPEGVADLEVEKRLRETLPALAPGLTLRAVRYRGLQSKGIRIQVTGVCPHLATAPRGDGPLVELGDDRLDGRLFFMGPPAPLRAVMDRAARGLLAELLDMSLLSPGSLRIGGGVLSVDLPQRSRGFWWEAVVELGRPTFLLARLLQEPPDTAERLGRNALHDPDADVRLANLTTLVQEYAGHPRTADVLRQAVKQVDPSMRLAAALALADEGRPVLSDLARTAPDDCAAAAIAALGTLPLDTLRQILDWALSPRPGDAAPLRPLSARACVDLLARTRAPDAVDLLARAAATAHTAMALAAVRALARIRTVAVVAALQEVARTQADGDVIFAARDAVSDLTRDLGVAPGQLSLSGGQAGEVTLAEDTAGRLSRADGRDGEDPA